MDLKEDIKRFYEIIEKPLEKIIFYNSDADGISSALLIKKIIKNAKFIPHPSAILKEFEIFPYLNDNSLIILLDFGSSEESEKAAKMLGPTPSILIDHHPINKNTVKNYSLVINSFKYFKNGSSYPTGWLVSKILEYKKINSGGLERIACAGDKSKIIKVDENDKEIALAFDYISFYKNNNLEFYEKVLQDSFLLQTIIVEAKEKIEGCFNKAKRNIKLIDKKGVKIGVINLDKVIKKFEFPNRGKIATKFIEEGIVDVVFGYGKGMILIRSSGKVDLIKKLDEVKKELGSIIISGGGHNNAMAIKTKKGWESFIISYLINKI